MDPIHPLWITVKFSQVQYSLGEGMEDEGSGYAQVELTFSNPSMSPRIM